MVKFSQKVKKASIRMQSYFYGLFLLFVYGMRTFGFVIVLWAVFVNPAVSRVGMASLLTTILILAGINLVLTLAGLVPHGDYFTTRLFPLMHMSHLSHMYGQALVGGSSGVGSSMAY